MKIKKALYCFVVIITVVLLSTLTVHAATCTSALLWTESGSTFTRAFTYYEFTGIKLPRAGTDTSDIHILIMTFLRQLGPNSSHLITSASPEENNIRDNISRGKFDLVPEPLTLLLLGTGLMGIALYRRLKNK